MPGNTRIRMTADQLKIGHTYEGKVVKIVGLFDGLYNDRQILWIGLEEVQYDSPTVGHGKHYPKVSIAAFLKWAAEDITEKMPAGEWRRHRGML